MNRLLQQVGTGLAAVGTAWVGINQLIFNVDAGCRGVMFDRFRGVLDDVKGEGPYIHYNSFFLEPFLLKLILKFQDFIKKISFFEILNTNCISRF